MTHRFLLVQLADIGDLILTTPAITALREAHPTAYLTLLTSPHAVKVMDEMLIDDMIIVHKDLFSTRTLANPWQWGALVRFLGEVRRGRFDTIIFFHHFTLKLGTLKFALISFASGVKRRIGFDNSNGFFLTESLPDMGFGAKHQAQYWLDLVALVGAKAIPRSAQVKLEFFDAVSRVPNMPKIVIHPGSGGYNLARRWEAQQFAKVADRLHDILGAQIVLVGTAEDGGEDVRAAMNHEPLDLTGRTTLPQLASVIQQADCFIGADSGIMHLAAAVRTPLIAIFGPSNPQAWGPWTPDSLSIVVRSAPECSPCSYVGHEIGLREGCPARTCMRMVAAEQVVQACQNLLNGTPKEAKSIELPSPVRTNRLYILGSPVDRVTYADWMAQIGEWVKHGSRCHHVCTTNPEFTMIARQDVNFRNILKRADLCIPDGYGLLWAARRMGQPLPERVTGSDGVPMIAEYAANNGWRLFLLGAGPGVAQQAANDLQNKHPDLRIVGIYEGSPTPNEEDRIVEKVNVSGADILLVAYGAPEQDKWIARNLPRLNTKMAMGVGGAFDFIAGVVPRAPLWMRNAGLEWAFRLIKQPWRIGRMMRLPHFVILFLFTQWRNNTH